MITIIDYGMGNVHAFCNTFKRLNIPFVVAKSASELEGATKIILPGVGSFDHALNLLDASGMREELEKLVFDDQVAVLGVCVGMQILSNGSDEGVRSGLGWIPGKVKTFKTEKGSENLPLPHMGWNDVSPLSENGLLNGLEKDAKFYFLHSYFFECDVRANVVATSSYGIDFSCVVNSGNVFGVQFHPEKSHHYGAMLLKNFAEL